jgi:hypothetical protein
VAGAAGAYDRIGGGYVGREESQADGCAVGEVVVDTGQIDVVEHVEDLAAEFQLKPFGEIEAFDDGRVDV